MLPFENGSILWFCIYSIFYTNIFLQISLSRSSSSVRYLIVIPFLMLFNPYSLDLLSLLLLSAFQFNFIPLFCPLSSSWNAEPSQCYLLQWFRSTDMISERITVMGDQLCTETVEVYLPLRTEHASHFSVLIYLIK